MTSGLRARTDPDDEPDTLKPVLAAPAPAEDEEATTLSLESRLLRAFQDATKPTLTPSDPPIADDREPDTSLDELLPRTVPAPVLPRSERQFFVDLPTAPAELVVDPFPVGPRGQATPLQRPAQRTRWGRWFALVVLAALLLIGFRNRATISAFAHQTAAAAR